MMTRLILVLFLALAPTMAVPSDLTVRDRIVQVLRDDGYAEIRVTRTLLGRMRFVASDVNRRREIVINPSTGVILRDYVKLLSAKPDLQNSGGSGSNSGSGSGSDDDDDDNDDDSGSGSSGSGSDDD